MRRAEREVSPRLTRPGATKSNQATDDFPSIVTQAVETLTHHERVVLRDALLEAWPTTWERRARALEAARPQPGDFHGRATREDLRARWEALTEAAKACRARAQVSPLDLVVPDVETVLREAS